MLLTELNVDDLNTLTHFRVERFLHLFATSLPSCLIQLDGHQTLTIHCPSTEIVDDLLDDLEELCDRAWLILGVNALCLYFGEEEVLQTNTYYR
ncbi:hypothetical protein [Chamaesiphon sp. VAR_48_metabat_403]|uniref:hypothetical protein n=1 Tax=Chamaesiphon sp. VAR_48_metabat_403 TaxID=2964700 RepID=UPI00286D9ED5|nr:hypothetical protein [Chamaesiphon sp. VAR_48_metabat_403]